MTYEQAKRLTGRHSDDVLGKRYMDSKGAYSDQHEAKTAGFSRCAHRYPRAGYEYTAVRTSTAGAYALYSLWARKIESEFVFHTW
jgi:hypothetical protein